MSKISKTKVNYFSRIFLIVWMLSLSFILMFYERIPRNITLYWILPIYAGIFVLGLIIYSILFTKINKQPEEINQNKPSEIKK